LQACRESVHSAAHNPFADRSLVNTSVLAEPQAGSFRSSEEGAVGRVVERKRQAQHWGPLHWEGCFTPSPVAVGASKDATFGCYEERIVASKGR